MLNPNSLGGRACRSSGTCREGVSSLSEHARGWRVLHTYLDLQDPALLP